MKECYIFHPEALHCIRNTTEYEYQYTLEMMRR